MGCGVGCFCSPFQQATASLSPSTSHPYQPLPPSLPFSFFPPSVLVILRNHGKVCVPWTILLATMRRTVFPPRRRQGTSDGMDPWCACPYAWPLVTLPSPFILSQALRMTDYLTLDQQSPYPPFPPIPPNFSYFRSSLPSLLPPSSDFSMPKLQQA